VIRRESLSFKELEHVLINKADQLFKAVLQARLPYVPWETFMFTRRDGLKLTPALARAEAEPVFTRFHRSNRVLSRWCWASLCYLAAWWNMVNWDKAAAHFAKAPV
jgi:hypothetical protein